MTTKISIGEAYCSEIYIDVEYIEAAYTFSDTTVDTGETITFNGSTSTGDVNWSWDFDNDDTIDDYGEEVTHSYTLAGLYTVDLTTYDSNDLNDSIDAQQITVKQNISLEKNANNDGINYITWGATSSIEASELAEDACLENGDTIKKYNTTSGFWDIAYVKGGAGDFTINRWDHIQIHLTNAKSFSVTPDAAVQNQNYTMVHNGNNNGYNYITWSGESTIKASEFAQNAKLTLSNNTITVYDHTTGEWRNAYADNLPPPAKASLDFDIQPYDVICIKISSNLGGDYYDSDNY